MEVMTGPAEAAGSSSGEQHTTARRTRRDRQSEWETADMLGREVGEAESRY